MSNAKFNLLQPRPKAHPSQSGLARGQRSGYRAEGQTFHRPSSPNHLPQSDPQEESIRTNSTGRVSHGR